jgi:phosphatidylinositol 4-kinase A
MSNNYGGFNNHLKSQQQLELLLLLISNEIQRICIWLNPTDQPSSNIILQQENDLSTKIISDNDKKLLNTDNPTNSQWSKLVKAAWNIDPRISFNLFIRFRFAKIIKKEIKDLVLADAEFVTDIPELVIFLATKKNLTKNIPQLSYLLQWKTGSLINAIYFLNKPYVFNPYLRHYALRILKKFSGDVLVFYLAQLCQNLRHDKTNELKKFLISICKKDNFFAHQLLWTLRTEIIKKDELSDEEKSEIKESEKELSTICEDFFVDIVINFSKEQFKLYEEEFEFFDKLTNISGYLVPFDKPLRKDELRKKLKDFELTKNLYLPTSTDWKMTGMVKESSTPLKSSKKVPFLLPFNVSKIDKKTQKKIEDKKKLIFKMGDGKFFFFFDLK